VHLDKKNHRKSTKKEQILSKLVIAIGVFLLRTIRQTRQKILLNKAKRELLIESLAKIDILIIADAGLSDFPVRPTVINIIRWLYEQEQDSLFQKNP
jgi:hypothetical protein